jgi:hypothetical protein
VDDALRFRRAGVRAADLVPRFLLPSVSALLARTPPEKYIEAVTGLPRDGWRRLARAFPRLGEDPGPEAARARRRAHFLVGRALASARHGPLWRGAPLDPRPAVYATAHVGDLRALRYLLRQRIPAANVVSTEDYDRGPIPLEDAAFDARFPGDFPHAFFSGRAHRLRAALRRGSLVIAADLAKPDARRFPCLGGELALDARPFRLARLAGVPCRALFLTAPEGRLTITAGDALPADDAEAVASFAELFARVADESPYEIDARTWAARLPAP